MHKSYFTLVLYFLMSSVFAQQKATIDFGDIHSIGSPFIFGATQPRGLTDKQWDILQQQGFTFARSQADLSKLIPCTSVEDYNNNINGCADAANWNWKSGIYGNDFAQRAIDRNMKVCLVIKNATWNRYDEAPVDEETMPRDLVIWKDIVGKIINHYKGGITYIECFNEVDRRPGQFYVTGSGYSAKEGYKKVVQHAIKAALESEHPDTRVGGPAAAGFGLTEMEWLLEDTTIRSHLGCVTFHDFDNPEYPYEDVQKIKNLLKKYDSNPHIVRSSHTPEFGRNDPFRRPGLTQPEWIAPLIIGALKDGLHAAGFWEIQNKSGADDHRYWFNGNNTVSTSNTFIMMSKTFKLGKDASQIFNVVGMPYAHAMGAMNNDGEQIVVFVSKSHAYDIDLTIKNVPFTDSVLIEVYRGDAAGDGQSVLDSFCVRMKNNQIEFNYTIPEKSVVGFKIKAPTSCYFNSSFDINNDSFKIFPNPVKEKA